MAYMRPLPERLADATIHVIGILGSILATVLLADYVGEHQGGLPVAAIAIYGGAAILAFVASAVYHLTPWEEARPTLQRIDHATIYLKIAGSYTPIVVLIGTAFAYAVLGFVWLVALIAAVAKLKSWLLPGVRSTRLYLALGWAAVVLFWPMQAVLPGASVALIVFGGVLYSVGAIFNHLESLRYSTAIWHSFVLSASACIYAAIALSLTQS